MHIVFVTFYPDKNINITGGVSGVSYYLIKALKQLDCDIKISIITPAFNTSQDHTKIEGIDVYYVNMIKIIPAFISNFTIFRKKINRLIKKLNPDIVHFQAMGSWALNYSGPCVFTVHGIAEKDVLYSSKPFLWLQKCIISYIENLARKQLRHVIIINKYVLDELSPKISGNKYLIPNPVDDAYFNIERQIDMPIVLFAGSVIKRKNILGLLHIFKRTVETIPSSKLIIAGEIIDKEYYNICQNFINNNKLYHNVVFLGQVNLDKMKQLISKASVLALFSFQETAPLIIEEVMAAGLPIVASNTCGLPYMVTHGEHGYLIDNNNIEGASNYLVKLLQDKNMSIIMGKNARKYALDNFHPQIVAVKTLEIYKAILRN